MSGYLHKLHKGKKWRKLWFVLKDKVLYQFKATQVINNHAQKQIFDSNSLANERHLIYIYYF